MKLISAENYFFRKWRPPRSFHSILFVRTLLTRFDLNTLLFRSLRLQGAVPIVYAVPEVLFLTVTWELNSVLWYIYIYTVLGTSEFLLGEMMGWSKITSEHSYFFRIFQEIVLQEVGSSGANIEFRSGIVKVLRVCPVFIFLFILALFCYIS